MQVPS